MENRIEIVTVKIHGGGWLLNGNVFVPDAPGNVERDAIISWISAGNNPEPEYTNEELLAQSIIRFEDITDAYIQNKIDEYNTANGVKFKNIDAFTKYAVNTESQYNAIANRFIVYADNIWKAVREYQKTIITIPTDEEFKAVLDNVVF
jgi:hypothetical protein